MFIDLIVNVVIFVMNSVRMQWFIVLLVMCLSIVATLVLKRIRMGITNVFQDVINVARMD